MDAAAIRDLTAFFAWCIAHQVRLYATFPSTIDFPEYHTPIATAGADRLVQWYRDGGVKTPWNAGDLPLSGGRLLRHQLPP